MKAACWSWIATLGLLAACATMTGQDSKPALITSQNAERLYQQWELRQLTLDGSRVIMHPDADMTLAFSPDGRVGGIAAVNSFSGRYELSPQGVLSWPSPGFASTRKAGPPELMEKETAYLAALPRPAVRSSPGMPCSCRARTATPCSRSCGAGADAPPRCAPESQRRRTCRT
jgi:heat shock protein HslJ